LQRETSPEAFVFYKKMEGDYCRYKAETSDDDDKAKAITASQKAYRIAWKLSEVDVSRIQS